MAGKRIQIYESDDIVVGSAAALEKEKRPGSVFAPAVAWRQPPQKPRKLLQE